MSGIRIMLLLGCFVFALLVGIGAATGDAEATRYWASSERPLARYWWSWEYQA